MPVTVYTTAAKPTPFHPLTLDEIDSIVEWVQAPERGLNLTDVTDPNITLAMSDNYIWHVETLKPNKTDVLAYLDGCGTKVPHYARVVINEGGKFVPIVTEYFVSWNYV